MPPHPNFARREQLLDDLVQIFVAEGFLHLRIGALAERLRCSRSTLYELADNKELLFARVVERLADQAVAEASAAAEQFDSPIERISRFFDIIANWQTRCAPALWRDIAAFPPAAARFDERRATGVQRVQHYMDEGVASGTLRPLNTAFVAHILWYASRASRDPAVLEAVGIDSRSALLETRRLLADGIRLRNADGSPADGS